MQFMSLFTEDPGYVYDIFNHHKNRYLIVNKSRVVPMIEDRDYFYFNNESLERIKKTRIKNIL